MAIKIYGFRLVVPTGKLMEILAAASFEGLKIHVSGFPSVSLRQCPQHHLC